MTPARSSSLLLSGVTNLARVAETVGTPYFLPKPYALDDVRRLISRALEERCAPSPQLLQPEAG
jgi:hypothetical protein